MTWETGLAGRLPARAALREAKIKGGNPGEALLWAAVSFFPSLHQSSLPAAGWQSEKTALPRHAPVTSTGASDVFAAFIKAQFGLASFWNGQVSKTKEEKPSEIELLPLCSGKAATKGITLSMLPDFPAKSFGVSRVCIRCDSRT